MALSRKRRIRVPRRWTEGLADLHDYMQPEPQRCVSARPCLTDKDRIVVTDDWPEQVPIGDAELRLIEGHLSNELDALFGSLP